MTRECIILRGAEQDVIEAYDWYEEREPGLGEEFLRCVEACISSIAREPELHPIAYQNYHRVLTRRFPFAIFYEMENNRVIIYSVFHCSRDPGKWRSRLRKK